MIGRHRQLQIAQAGGRRASHFRASLCAAPGGRTSTRRSGREQRSPTSHGTRRTQDGRRLRHAALACGRHSSVDKKQQAQQAMRRRRECREARSSCRVSEVDTISKVHTYCDLASKTQRRINQENSETETDCFLVYVLIIQGWREWEIVLAPEPQFLIW